jgi:outer membrane protein
MRILILLMVTAGSVGAAEGPPVLTLQEALARAQRQHPNIEATRALLEAARGRFETARAGFIPALTGSAAYVPQTANFVLTPSFQRVFSAAPGTSATVRDVTGADREVSCIGASCPNPVPAAVRTTAYDLISFWSLAVGITWTAWDWGRTPYAYRAARTGIDAQKANVDSVVLQVALDVKLAYYGALAAETQLSVAEEAVASQKKHLAQARAFLEVGQKTKIDVAASESDLANAELTLARARGALDSARVALANALGDEGWTPVKLLTPSEPAVDEPLAGEALYDEAVKNRPEPRELSLRARSFADTARSLRGAYLPQLQLSLGPSFAGTDISGLTTNFTISLALAYPLTGMNPFAIHGQVREARANERAFIAQERASRNLVRLETANAVALLRSAREAVVAARKLVTAARERRDLAEGRYQAGVGSILELSDAETNFVNARFSEVRALLDVGQAHARLDRALGRP